METVILPPKVIIGLGNPGPAYKFTRHNIGFRVVDALAHRFGGQWRSKDKMELAQIQIGTVPVTLVKPQTFMNTSGAVIPSFAKTGIRADDILVVHDELEFPFGKMALRKGGSARGHNGLKSLISYLSDQFARLRFGIGRPAVREEVPHYVLQNFKERPEEIDLLIETAADMIEKLYQ